MKHVLLFLIYVGLGCAYQSTYTDINVRDLATANVPVSTFGHIFAWPFIILYHLLGIIGIGLLVMIAVGVGVFFFLWAKDAIQHRVMRNKIRNKIRLGRRA